MDYKQEVAIGNDAKRAMKYMRPKLDEMSEALYAQFVNTDPKETENLSFIVIHHKLLMDIQQDIQNDIDTARLAQIELDKTDN